jgi:hypothetical protein
MRRCENCNCKIQIKRFHLQKEDFFYLEHPEKFKDKIVVHFCSSCRGAIEHLRNIQRSY